MTTTQKVANLATLDELASKLDPKGRQIEAGLRSRWNASRREQGLVLKAYQDLYKPLRLWKKFLAAVGIVQRTAYRLIDDAEAVSDLPATVLAAAESLGVDLAERKHRSAVAAIKEQLTDVEPNEDSAAQIVSKVIPFRTPFDASVPASNEDLEAVKPGKSLEDFTEKTVRAFEARYKDYSEEVRDAEVQYVFEVINATLRSSVCQLQQYGRPELVRKPCVDNERVA